EAAGQRILTDPWLTEGAYLGTWFHTHLLADAGVTPETIPKEIDYLFLSHEHLDHMDPNTLRHFSPDVPLLICQFATPKFRRRRALLRSLVQRVKLTKPRVAVPAAGPCTVLTPELLWLNSEERGIFIDPQEAVRALREANLPVDPLCMAATDVWDHGTGFEP